MSTAIYTAYHAPAPRIESRSIRPIHVGRAGAKAPLAGMIGDDSGTHISDLNGAYAEWTALFWAWKNDRDATRIGLMHYRRWFDFDNQHPSPQTEVHAPRIDIPDYAARAEAWLAANPQVDLVLPRPHLMPVTVRVNYRDQHDPRDLEFIEAEIARQSPAYSQVFERVLEGRELLLANMFLARREIVEEYCAWAFPLLEALRGADIPRPYTSQYNARYLGFMAERLFTAFVTKYLADHPETVVHRAGILNLARTLVVPQATGAQFNGAGEVNVAFSSDRAYLPQTAAMLASLADHADPDRDYNLFYLHENIGERDLDLLRSLLVTRPRVTLHPINVGRPFGDEHRARHHAPSNATFNRFLLFDLLPDVARLVYLDVDIVLCGDVAELADIDMGETPLAAVRDALMTRVLAVRVMTPDPEVPDLYAYLSETLGLNDDQIARYFNAGVLVFNFAAMDTAKTGKELREMLSGRRYFFRDQDILNVYFKDRKQMLPDRYNVHNSDRAAYVDVPAAIRAAALAAKADPFLVHFAAAQHKPWEEPEVEFAGLFWTTLAKTPYWYELLEATRKRRSLATRMTRLKTWKHWAVVSGRWVAQKLPWAAPHLVRAYRWALDRFPWLN